MGKVTSKKLENYEWVEKSCFYKHPNYKNNGIFFDFRDNTVNNKTFCVLIESMNQLKNFILNETGEEMVKVESKKQLEKKLRNVGFVDTNFRCDDKDYLNLGDETCVQIRVDTDVKDFTYFPIGGVFSVIDWQSFKNFKDLRKQVKKLTGIDIKKQGNEYKVTAELLERNCFELHKEDSKAKGCKFYDVSLEGEFLRIKLGTNEYCTYTKETEDDCEWDIHKLESKEDLKDLIFKVYGLLREKNAAK